MIAQGTVDDQPGHEVTLLDIHSDNAISLQGSNENLSSTDDKMSSNQSEKSEKLLHEHRKTDTQKRRQH